MLWLRRARELGMNREKPRRCRAFEDDVEGRDCSPDADDKAQANGEKTEVRGSLNELGVRHNRTFNGHRNA